MRITRPLLSFDLETTGVDVCKDRIVEMGVSVLHPDGTVKPSGWRQRFNPGIPIPAEATAVHHITDEDVADMPPFSQYATRIQERMQGKDLAGYNLSRFDLCLLDEEMRRCGLRLDLKGVQVIDAAAIFFKKCPRDLDAAVERFCKRKRTEGHSAGIDAQDSLEVILGQMREFADLEAMELSELAAFCRPDDREYVDLAGKLYRDAEGFACFAFGKNEGKRVLEQGGYVDWMARNNFPGSTMDCIQLEFDRELVTKGKKR